jgi:hypothetical protein
MKRAVALQALVAVVLGSGAGLVPANSDEFLIRETESLRNTLSLSDPSRLPLTLRLADLCMEDAASAEYSRKLKLQRQALSLYDEALASGGSGRLEGPARIRVEFQKARILSELGEVDRALPIWKQVARQRDLRDLAREAALKLAESGDVANAASWYAIALELCSGGDLCSYVHYKRAWLYKQASKNGLADERAISEIELALFDSKGQVREEALRDYLVFLGEFGGDLGKASAISKVEALSQRLQRPHMMGELAEAFFAAGNKAAGTVALAQAQRRMPQFARLCRLAEEQYGARDWDAFRLSLEELASPAAVRLMAKAGDSERVEGEKLLRRLVIQLDGERISQPDRKADFQKSTLVYLSLFPASAERAKFQEGFLASEQDATLKLDQLARWIEAEPTNARLREFRASIAQKAGMNALVASEMSALARISGSREHRYLEARALYEGKDYARALPIFRELASASKFPQGRPDRWAVQSQNLVLDILAMDKSARGLDQVMAQASSWVDAPWAAVNALSTGVASELAGEIAGMRRVRDQARFEKAVLLGQSPEALVQFMDFCRQGFFADKSCENARVLSIQTRNQPALIEVLSLLGPAQHAVLASELERSGEFGRSADLLEKQGFSAGQASAQAAFKIALLRELSGDGPAWSRAVSALMSKVASGSLKLSEAEERLWLSMARDSGVLATGSGLALKGLKSPAVRGQLAEQLEQLGHGSSETRKIILGSALMTGPTWKRWVFEDLESRISEQKKISFYGRNSKALFERRLKAVATLASQADSWIAKGDESVRVAIASKLQGVYEDLAREIRESPIPDGIPQEAIPELKAGLEEMARPFEEKAKVYSAAVVPVADSLVSQSAHPLQAGEAVQPNTKRIGSAMARLARNPDSVAVLTELRDEYRSLRKERLASYFEGRIQAGGNP